MNDSKISPNTNLLTIFRKYFSAAYLEFSICIAELEKQLGIRYISFFTLEETLA